MKTAKLYDYLMWKGKLAQVVGIADRKSVIIELKEKNLCPHCSGDLGFQQIQVIESSPLFQENAEPINTIS